MVTGNRSREEVCNVCNVCNVCGKKSVTQVGNRLWPAMLLSATSLPHRALVTRRERECACTSVSIPGTSSPLVAGVNAPAALEGDGRMRGRMRGRSLAVSRLLVLGDSVKSRRYFKGR